MLVVVAIVAFVMLIAGFAGCIGFIPIMVGGPDHSTTLRRAARFMLAMTVLAAGFIVLLLSLGVFRYVLGELANG